MKKLIFIFFSVSMLYSINSYSAALYNNLNPITIDDDIGLLGTEIKYLSALLPPNLKIYIKVLDKYIPYDPLSFPINNISYYIVQVNNIYPLLENYYDYNRLLHYLSFAQEGLNRIGYRILELGLSVQGRILYALIPKHIDTTKITIVMFFRQHGNEYAQNWIMEGLINTIIAHRIPAWLNNMQFVIYPMINPDGADNITRYNANNYDLNRIWDAPKDEITIIQSHIHSLITSGNLNVGVVWDMHGSIGDYINRMPASLVPVEYYNEQSNIILTLGKYDPWQNGTFIHSSGNPGMARIVMFSSYGHQALTHETNDYDSLRTVIDFQNQGVAIYNTMWELFNYIP
ncbi:MAG: M14 family zinc carboxypeptidase [bacterium]